MEQEGKFNQLKKLLSELTPAIDNLVAGQEIFTDNVNKLVLYQERSNLAVGELRLSNMRFASAMEKLIKLTNLKID